MNTLQLSMSPNPAANQVNIAPGTITATNDRNSAVATFSTVKLYDNAGNLRRQWKFAPGSQQGRIDVSGIPTGVYTTEISDGKNQGERQKLVVGK